jgi:hypothetical protein
MPIWAHIANGTVDDYRPGRPAGSWRNISNIEGLSDAELNALGWRQTTEIQSTAYFTDSPRFTVVGTAVTALVSTPFANVQRDFRSMIKRRVAVLEADGHIVDALLLMKEFNL